MFVEDLIHQNNLISNQDINTIRSKCSQFIIESRGRPVYKALPTFYSTIHKVKARFKKRSDDISGYFNRAFESKTSNLRQRAIFTYANPPTLTEGTELFYVFPTNSYKFLYSLEVVNSNDNYKQMIDTIYESFGNTNEVANMVTDLLKYTYSTQNLYEGIMADVELIFYGIPYYYAIKVSEIDYNQIIN